MTFVNNSRITEDGRQFRTREGHFMAKIFGRTRYIKIEI